MLATWGNMNLSSLTDIDIDIKYKHYWINNPLILHIKIDTKTIAIDVSGKKENSINKKINLQEGSHQISISCDNKTNIHTITDKSGKIIEDSYMQIVHFKINDIDVIELVKKRAYFIKKDGDKIIPNDGIWLNGTLCFDFKTPLYDWLLESFF